MAQRTRRAGRERSRVHAIAIGREGGAALSLALLLACGSSACSSRSEPAAVDLPHFQDLTSAPPAIERAARSVVRIQTATASGTGSFISSTGLLLTNNHVLGAPVCPLEGCSVWISIAHQRGVAPQDPSLVFAVPQSVDLGLDVATLQLYEEQGGAMLSSPDFLNIVSHSALELLGTHVFVVGHPEGSLKHWTDGTVVDTEGEWFKSTAFTLPGDSGSPTLDDQGNIVGLIHRGPTGEDLITSEGVSVYSIGTPSESVLAAASAPLPSGMISVTEPTTAANLLENNAVFLNGQAPDALIDGKQTSVLSVLAQACDSALDRSDFVSLDEMDTAQAPCYDAMSWLECRTDLRQPSPLRVCREAAAWRARFQRLSEAARALNGQVSLNAVSFAIAHLAATEAEGRTDGRGSLSVALSEAHTPLDLHLTPYLAAFGIATYAEMSVAAYVRGYRQVSHYELAASNLANAAAWLYDRGEFTKAELRQMLQDLANDASVSVGSKLLIEELRYEFRVLD